jgi:hypothetical protein
VVIKAPFYKLGNDGINHISIDNPGNVDFLKWNNNNDPNNFICFIKNFDILHNEFEIVTITPI